MPKRSAAARTKSPAAPTASKSCSRDSIVNNRLLAIAELGDHVVELFERDEPPAMTQLVLVDRFGELDHFRAERLAGIDELPAFAPLFPLSAGLPPVGKRSDACKLLGFVND